MTYDRQLATVRNLETPPHGYELRAYSVNRLPHYSGSGFLPILEVNRTYGRDGMRAEYHECVFVGPRGGTKTAYKSFY
jgi:hypothetical protein